MGETSWRVDTPGHLWVSVPHGQTAEVERVWGTGRRVNLFEDERPPGWIRIVELRRVDERDGEFDTCWRSSLASRRPRRTRRHRPSVVALVRTPDDRL